MDDIKIYADNLDAGAIGLINAMKDNHVFDGSKVRIMPDCHPGKGTVVGLTMSQKDTKKLCPGLLGPDIGCGVSFAKIKIKKHIEMQHLDKVIKGKIPAGDKNRSTDCQYVGDIVWNNLDCLSEIDEQRAARCLGTLGGGNHFIELDRDDEGEYYLVVHCGSRYIGARVYDYYHSMADKQTISDKVPHAFTYFINDDDAYRYLNDAHFCEDFAKLNRYVIIKTICREMKWDIDELYNIPHNYISPFYEMINEKPEFRYMIRKGAISAEKGNKVIIPLNMRDGCIIGTGKGNNDCNNSAPHGAGRLYSRKDAEGKFTLREFKSEMKGIYSTTISRDTIDESPMAYKDSKSIIDAISDMIEIDKFIKPVYNFKASSK